MNKRVSERIKRRRLRGGQLLLEGRTQAEVAKELGVSRPTVHAWNLRLQNEGLSALMPRQRGRPAKMNAKSRSQLAQALVNSATTKKKNDGDVTLRDIARLIEVQIGTTYSVSQVSRLLAKMRQSDQLPSRLDARAVRRWKLRRWLMTMKVVRVLRWP
jgi:transposase